MESDAPVRHRNCSCSEGDWPVLFLTLDYEVQRIQQIRHIISAPNLGLQLKVNKYQVKRSYGLECA